MKHILSFFLIAFLAACDGSSSTHQGYVEGDYLYIASSGAGVLDSLSVARGQEIKKGDALYTIDRISLNASVVSARAEVTKAKATLDNLTKGQRDAEIEVVVQQYQQAKASFEKAESDFKRAELLLPTGGIAQSDMDATRAVYEAAKAHVFETAARIKTAKMGAREDEVRAALAMVDVAEQKLIQAQRRLDEASPKALQDARVEETYYNIGEFVGAGMPVVSLLPPGNVKIRFFVPEPKVAKIAVGQKAMIACDGCGDEIEGKITYIASRGEYTPPVIYSVGSREKLVFQVEVMPSSFTDKLKPGLPVDVELGG